MKYFILACSILVAASCQTDVSNSGDALFEAGKFSEAVKAYNDYLETNPDHVNTIYNRGRAYEELGEGKKAMADFAKIVEIDPRNISAYLSLAKLAYNEHNYNQVLVHAGKALELNENSAQGHFLAARGAHQLGYFEQALESYNNAISINKDFGDAFLYRGALKIGMEKQKSACEDFKFAKLLDVEGADKAVRDYCK